MPRIRKPRWEQLTKENFVQGATVRVNPEVARPDAGWGAILKLEEGVITSGVAANNFFLVDFPSQRNWSAYLPQMQIKVN